MAIYGSGHAVPCGRVTSEELDARLGHSEGTVRRSSGVVSRYVAAPHETAATLAGAAARRALEAAGIEPGDLDCVVAANGTADLALPYNAALVHAELGLSPVSTPAFDVGASCLSFIAAVDAMSWPVAAGRYERVLIVSADIPSCGLDWDDLGASAIFGDGAAAVVIGPAVSGSGSKLLAAGVRTYSEGVELCQVPGGGTRFHPSRIDEAVAPLMRFQMDGRGVFKLASRVMPKFVDDLLSEAGISRSDLDWVVPHQASHLAIEHLKKRLGFRREMVVTIYEEYGNQVAASLPTALDVAIRSGRVQRGDRVLLLGTGAGLSVGGAVLEY